VPGTLAGATRAALMEKVFRRTMRTGSGNFAGSHRENLELCWSGLGEALPPSNEDSA
jgi:hypothetical protein